MDSSSPSVAANARLGPSRRSIVVPEPPLHPRQPSSDRPDDAAPMTRLLDPRVAVERKKQYIRTHQLSTVLDDVTRELLEAQPDDPLRFLQERLIALAEAKRLGNDQPNIDELQLLQQQQALLRSIDAARRSSVGSDIIPLQTDKSGRHADDLDDDAERRRLSALSLQSATAESPSEATDVANGGGGSSIADVGGMDRAAVALPGLRAVETAPQRRAVMPKTDTRRFIEAVQRETEEDVAALRALLLHQQPIAPHPPPQPLLSAVGGTRGALAPRLANTSPQPSISLAHVESSVTMPIDRAETEPYREPSGVIGRRGSGDAAEEVVVSITARPAAADELQLVSPPDVREPLSLHQLQQSGDNRSRSGSMTSSDNNIITSPLVGESTVDANTVVVPLLRMPSAMGGSGGSSSGERPALLRPATSPTTANVDASPTLQSRSTTSSARQATLMAVSTSLLTGMNSADFISETDLPFATRSVLRNSFNNSQNAAVAPLPAGTDDGAGPLMGGGQGGSDARDGSPSSSGVLGDLSMLSVASPKVDSTHYLHVVAHESRLGSSGRNDTLTASIVGHDDGHGGAGSGGSVTPVASSTPRAAGLISTCDAPTHEKAAPARGGVVDLLPVRMDEDESITAMLQRRAMMPSETAEEVVVVVVGHARSQRRNGGGNSNTTSTSSDERSTQQTSVGGGCASVGGGSMDLETFLDAVDDLIPARVHLLGSAIRQVAVWFFQLLLTSPSHSSAADDQLPLSNNFGGDATSALTYIVVQLQLACVLSGVPFVTGVQLTVDILSSAFLTATQLQVTSLERVTAQSKIFECADGLRQLSMSHVSALRQGPLSWSRHAEEALKAPTLPNSLSNSGSLSTSAAAMKLRLMPRGVTAAAVTRFAAAFEVFLRERVGSSTNNSSGSGSGNGSGSNNSASNPAGFTAATALVEVLQQGSQIAALTLLYTMPSATSHLAIPSITIALYAQRMLIALFLAANGGLPPRAPTPIPPPALLRRAADLWLNKRGMLHDLTGAALASISDKMPQTLRGALVVTESLTSEIHHILFGLCFDHTRVQPREATSNSGEVDDDDDDENLAGDDRGDVAKRRRQHKHGKGGDESFSADSIESGRDSQPGDGSVSKSNHWNDFSGYRRRGSIATQGDVGDDDAFGTEVTDIGGAAPGALSDTYEMCGFDVVAMLSCDEVLPRLADALRRHCRRQSLPSAHGFSTSSHPSTSINARSATASVAAGGVGGGAAEVTDEFAGRVLVDLCREILRLVHPLYTLVSAGDAKTMPIEGVDDAAAAVATPSACCTSLERFHSLVWLLSLRVPPQLFLSSSLSDLSSELASRRATMVDAAKNEDEDNSEDDEDNGQGPSSAQRVQQPTAHAEIAASSSKQDPHPPHVSTLEAHESAALWSSWCTIREFTATRATFGHFAAASILSEAVLPHSALTSPATLDLLARHLVDTVDAALHALVFDGEVQMLQALALRIHECVVTSLLVSSERTWRVLAVALANAAVRCGIETALRFSATPGTQELVVEEAFNATRALWLRFASALCAGHSVALRHITCTCFGTDAARSELRSAASLAFDALSAAARSAAAAVTVGAPSTSRRRLGAVAAIHLASLCGADQWCPELMFGAAVATTGAAHDATRSPPAARFAPRGRFSLSHAQAAEGDTQSSTATISARSAVAAVAAQLVAAHAGSGADEATTTTAANCEFAVAVCAVLMTLSTGNASSAALDRFNGGKPGAVLDILGISAAAPLATTRRAPLLLFLLRHPSLARRSDALRILMRHFVVIWIALALHVEPLFDRDTLRHLLGGDALFIAVALFQAVHPAASAGGGGNSGGGGASVATYFAALRRQLCDPQRAAFPPDLPRPVQSDVVPPSYRLAGDYNDAAARRSVAVAAAVAAALEYREQLALQARRSSWRRPTSAAAAATSATTNTTGSAAHAAEQWSSHARGALLVVAIVGLQVFAHPTLVTLIISNVVLVAGAAVIADAEQFIDRAANVDAAHWAVLLPHGPRFDDSRVVTSSVAAVKSAIAKARATQPPDAVLTSARAIVATVLRDFDRRFADELRFAIESIDMPHSSAELAHLATLFDTAAGYAVAAGAATSVPASTSAAGSITQATSIPVMDIVVLAVLRVLDAAPMSTAKLTLPITLITMHFIAAVWVPSHSHGAFLALTVARMHFAGVNVALLAWRNALRSSGTTSATSVFHAVADALAHEFGRHVTVSAPPHRRATSVGAAESQLQSLEDNAASAAASSTSTANSGMRRSGAIAELFDFFADRCCEFVDSSPTTAELALIEPLALAHHNELLLRRVAAEAAVAAAAAVATAASCESSSSGLAAVSTEGGGASRGSGSGASAANAAPARSESDFHATLLKRLPHLLLTADSTTLIESNLTAIFCNSRIILESSAHPPVASEVVELVLLLVEAGCTAGDLGDVMAACFTKQLARLDSLDADECEGLRGSALGLNACVDFDGSPSLAGCGGSLPRRQLRAWFTASTHLCKVVSAAMAALARPSELGTGTLTPANVRSFNSAGTFDDTPLTTSGGALGMPASADAFGDTGDAPADRRHVAPMPTSTTLRSELVQHIVARGNWEPLALALQLAGIVIPSVAGVAAATAPRRHMPLIGLLEAIASGSLVDGEMIALQFLALGVNRVHLSRVRAVFLSVAKVVAGAAARTFVADRHLPAALATDAMVRRTLASWWLQLEDMCAARATPLAQPTPTTTIDVPHVDQGSPSAHGGSPQDVALLSIDNGGGSYRGTNPVSPPQQQQHQQQRNAHYSAGVAQPSPELIESLTRFARDAGLGHTNIEAPLLELLHSIWSGANIDAVTLVRRSISLLLESQLFTDGVVSLTTFAMIATELSSDIARDIFSLSISWGSTSAGIGAGGGGGGGSHSPGQSASRAASLGGGLAASTSRNNSVPAAAGGGAPLSPSGGLDATSAASNKSDSCFRVLDLDARAIAILAVANVRVHFHSREAMRVARGHWASLYRKEALVHNALVAAHRSGLNAGTAVLTSHSTAAVASQQSAPATWSPSVSGPSTSVASKAAAAAAAAATTSPLLDATHLDIACGDIVTTFAHILISTDETTADAFEDLASILVRAGVFHHNIAVFSATLMSEITRVSGCDERIRHFWVVAMRWVNCSLWSVMTRANVVQCRNLLLLWQAIPSTHIDAHLRAALTAANAIVGGAAAAATFATATVSPLASLPGSPLAPDTAQGAAFPRSASSTRTMTRHDSAHGSPRPASAAPPGGGSGGASGSLPVPKFQLYGGLIPTIERLVIMQAARGGLPLSAPAPHLTTNGAAAASSVSSAALNSDDEQQILQRVAVRHMYANIGISQHLVALHCVAVEVQPALELMALTGAGGVTVASSSAPASPMASSSTSPTTTSGAARTRRPTRGGPWSNAPDVRLGRAISGAVIAAAHIAANLAASAALEVRQYRRIVDAIVRARMFSVHMTEVEQAVATAAHTEKRCGARAFERHGVLAGWVLQTALPEVCMLVVRGLRITDYADVTQLVRLWRVGVEALMSVGVDQRIATDCLGAVESAVRDLAHDAAHPDIAAYFRLLHTVIEVGYSITPNKTRPSELQLWLQRKAQRLQPLFMSLAALRGFNLPLCQLEVLKSKRVELATAPPASSPSTSPAVASGNGATTNESPPANVFAQSVSAGKLAESVYAIIFDGVLKLCLNFVEAENVLMVYREVIALHHIMTRSPSEELTRVLTLVSLFGRTVRDEMRSNQRLAVTWSFVFRTAVEGLQSRLTEALQLVLPLSRAKCRKINALPDISCWLSRSMLTGALGELYTVYNGVAGIGSSFHSSPPQSASDNGTVVGNGDGFAAGSNSSLALRMSTTEHGGAANTSAAATQTAMMQQQLSSSSTTVDLLPSTTSLGPSPNHAARHAVSPIAMLGLGLQPQSANSDAFHLVSDASSTGTTARVPDSHVEACFLLYEIVCDLMRAADTSPGGNGVSAAARSSTSAASARRRVSECHSTASSSSPADDGDSPVHHLWKHFRRHAIHPMAVFVFGADLCRIIVRELTAAASTSQSTRSATVSRDQQHLLAALVFSSCHTVVNFQKSAVKIELRNLGTSHSRNELRRRVLLLNENIGRVFSSTDLRRKLFASPLSAALKQSHAEMLLTELVGAIVPLVLDLLSSAADTEVRFWSSNAARKHLISLLDATIATGLAPCDLYAVVDAVHTFLDDYVGGSGTFAPIPGANDSTTSADAHAPGGGGGGNIAARRRSKIKHLTMKALELESNRIAAAMMRHAVDSVLSILIDLVAMVTATASPRPPSMSKSTASNRARSIDSSVSLDHLNTTAPPSLAGHIDQLHGIPPQHHSQQPNATLFLTNLLKISPQAKQQLGGEAYLPRLVDAVANEEDRTLIDFWFPHSATVVRGFINSVRVVAAAGTSTLTTPSASTAGLGGFANALSAAVSGGGVGGAGGASVALGFSPTISRLYGQLMATRLASLDAAMCLSDGARADAAFFWASISTAAQDAARRRASSSDGSSLQQQGHGSANHHSQRLSRIADVLNIVLASSSTSPARSSGGELLAAPLAPAALLQMLAMLSAEQLTALAEGLVGRWGPTVFELTKTPRSTEQQQQQQPPLVQITLSTAHANTGGGATESDSSNTAAAAASPPCSAAEEERCRLAFIDALRALRIGVTLLLELRSGDFQRELVASIDWDAIHKALVAGGAEAAVHAALRGGGSSGSEASLAAAFTSSIAELGATAVESHPPPSPTASSKPHSDGDSHPPPSATASAAASATVKAPTQIRVTLADLGAWFDVTSLYLAHGDDVATIGRVFARLTGELMKYLAAMHAAAARASPQQGLAPLRAAVRGSVSVMLVCLLRVREENSSAEIRQLAPPPNVMIVPERLIVRPISPALRKWWGVETVAELERKSAMALSVRNDALAAAAKSPSPTAPGEAIMSSSAMEQMFSTVFNWIFRAVQRIFLSYNGNVVNSFNSVIAPLAEKLVENRVPEAAALRTLFVMVQVASAERGCPIDELIELFSLIGKACVSAMRSSAAGAPADSSRIGSENGAIVELIRRPSLAVDPTSSSGGEETSASWSTEAPSVAPRVAVTTIHCPPPRRPHDDFRLLSYLWLSAASQVAKLRRHVTTLLAQSCMQRGVALTDADRHSVQQMLVLVHEVALLYHELAGSLMMSTTAGAAASAASAIPATTAASIIAPPSTKRRESMQRADLSNSTSQVMSAATLIAADPACRSPPVVADELDARVQRIVDSRADAPKFAEALLTNFALTLVESIGRVVPKLVTPVSSEAALRALWSLQRDVCDMTASSIPGNSTSASLRSSSSASSVGGNGASGRHSLRDDAAQLPKSQ